jgi:asparagine synthase (glutamine-hydrolysing)
MCGIAGQVRVDGGRIAPELLQRMCAAIEHRGPDARGEFIADGVALGIQRLRVIDLETGDQPISNEDGTVVVVLNGEIYNYRELRNELESRGHRFATNGDTETIVHLYEEHGKDCVRHLHGMFAFALWDARRRQLLIGRDRVGKKPLYYALDGERLNFASELQALLEDETVSREVDPAAVDSYLAYGYVPAPATAFRAVGKLPPAHTLVWRDGRVDIDRYWSLDYGTKLAGLSEDEACERIRSAVRAATRRRMVADVPLGAFLSGGIDSSTVVAAMAEASSSPVKTFSIGFDRQPFDELAHARRIAELFETEHHEFVVRPAAVEVLPRIVRHHGEPFADSSAIPSYYLAEMTRRHVTVALNGDGGDEAFGGYSRYVANSLAGRIDRVPLVMRRSLAALGGSLPAGGAISSPVQRARRLLGNLALDPAERYARYVQVFDGEQRNALYTDEFSASLASSDALETIVAPWQAASGLDVRDIMLEVDSATYLPGDLIAKIDSATMAHALEARSPLLDHEVLELAAALPAELKIRGREKKWILRRAMRGWIPDEILDRPKQGFSVPVSDWLRDELSAWAREVLLDRGTLARGWFRERGVRDMLDRHAAGWDAEAPRIWSLLMLELWQREVVERRAEPVESLLPV